MSFNFLKSKGLEAKYTAVKISEIRFFKNGFKHSKYFHTVLSASATSNAFLLKKFKIQMKIIFLKRNERNPLKILNSIYQNQANVHK